MFLSRRLVLALGFAAMVSAGLAGHAWADGEVNVYSYRQPALINPLFEAFTAKTGIKVRAVFADNGLVERLAQEGRNSPADVLLSADVGRLVEAAARGLAQPVTSPAITDKVPANLRDPQNLWFGLTMRARVVYASRERAPITAISYEELAEPKWKGKICMRPGNHPYNLGLIAAMIAHKGEDAARQWLQGLKANLAVKPSGNDRSQAKSVFAGECDLAIANTYYMGKMLTEEKEPEQKEWAKSVQIVFPASPDFGTHVNVSGMLMTSSAPNRDNALKLMEFLASDEAQRIYADGNFEYPVNPAVPASEIVQSWGTFTPDALNVAEIARLEPAASKLVDEVQFND
ncbi:Fe(3+) ABC transporter substrate-binding protein [Aestuariivirga sp.]|jgi:iron(III) transport system substrate-binding protein|uniref:Fe(3+) ABC transporter substrate-binding protein n=1 Tax=Aestuariivirga sp. TaxID=2650926 RepID=UPI0037845F73